VVSDRTIGPGHPVFLVAEAGVNHNGDPQLAHQLVDVAADAGADAVKFQAFDPDQLASPNAPKAIYQSLTTGTDETQLEMLRKLVLPKDAYGRLIEQAQRRGVLFLASPFDEASADFLQQLGIVAIKIPSGEITNLLFIRHLAKMRLPLLMSTGMSDLEEVRQAVVMVREYGNPPLALLHCVSCYPAPPIICNLRAMETMRHEFKVPVGWSDHTAGVAISFAAVARGANLLEKHFTLDRSMAGPDHRASLEPSELADLVKGVRQIEFAIGDGVKKSTGEENDTAIAARKSLHASRYLAAGTLLEECDLVARRPGTGISPASYRTVVGRRLLRSLRPGEMLSEGDLG